MGERDTTISRPPTTVDVDATLPALAEGASVPPAPVTRIAERYELLGLVGTGGMGSVYRAGDTELGELVALKVLRRELLRSPEVLARFRREVSLARKVTHRNVARTFDIGEHEGDRFLTMEFVEGESLGAVLEKEGAFDVSAFLDLACEICRGLEAAHGAGVIHLDLKPDNVLLARDGRVVLSDFGIARAVGGGETGARARATIAGTPAYMAPEQVVGDELDEAADVYALGAIFFEMLTGAAAWQGSTAIAVASARLLRPPPDPRERRAEIPGDVAAVVLRCMARERSDRFAAVADVRAALEAARLQRPSGAQRVQSPSVDAGVRAVEVLPFRNRGDVSDEYLADGFTEELIDALADSRHVRVRARGAVMSFKGTDRDPRDVGRMLGVDVVVEGSVRRAPGMLHVNARVIGVEDGYHLWARRFDVPEPQLLRVADEIAAAAARALDAPHDPRQRGQDDAVALDLFLRGRYDLNKGSAELTRAAIASFERALTRLPNEPMILAAYAQAQFRRFTYDADDPNAEQAAEIAERAARRALELSPTLGEARVALASLKLSVGDGAGAAREIVEALRVGGWTSPLVQDLHGRLLVEVGALDEGLGRLRAAVAIEPTLERARADILRTQALLGKWDDLTAVFAEGQSPGSVFWFLCARLSLWNPDAAWASELRARMTPLDFPQRPIAMGLVRVRLGEIDPDEVAPSLLAIAQRRGRAVRGPMFMRQLLAELRLFAGRPDEAVTEIERASELGLMDSVWLDRCVLLQKLAGDPRLGPVRAAVDARAAEVRAVLATAATAAKRSLV